MGSSNSYAPLNLSPCANCGKENSAFMGSSAWGHGQMCCSDACGRRLAAKIAGAMIPTEDWEAERVLGMRIRIKQLAAKVKGLTAHKAQEESK